MAALDSPFVTSALGITSPFGAVGRHITPDFQAVVRACRWARLRLLAFTDAGRMGPFINV